MADGLLARFPDLSTLVRGKEDASASITTLLDSFVSMSPDQGASPLASAANALTGLSSKLDVDIEGLSTRLPAAIDVIGNALPADSLEYVESIESAYATARDFLNNSPLVKAVPEGQTLQETALAVIQEAMGLLDSRIAGLAGGLIDSDTLQQVRDALDSIEQFRSDFPTDPSQFLSFISDNLIGVPPDVLRAPLDHLEQAYGSLVPVGIAATLTPARQALADAFNQLVTTIQALDPADAAAYVQIQAQLGVLEDGIDSVFQNTQLFYEQVQDALEADTWDRIMPVYQSLLEAITIENPFSMDAVIDGISGALEDILARFHLIFGVEDLTERIEGLGELIQSTFNNSALGQVRQTLLDFLGNISQAVEAIPTEEVQQAIEAMLNRAGQELEDLGIARVETAIDQAFQDIRAFVVENIDQAMANDVQDVLTGLLERVQDLPIAGLISQLTAALEQLDGLIAEVEATLESQLDSLVDLASRLDDLSFQPASDAVIGEIDDIKGRLDQVNPNALSDVERLAIQGALSVLEAIDMEDQVVNGLKEGYHAGEGEVRELLDELTAILQRLRDNLGDFSPEAVLGPLGEILERATGLIEGLNSTTLLRPLYDQVDNLVQELEAMSPGRVLDPLQPPYDSLMQVVDRLNPDQLVAPLNALYGEIDRFISLIDVTPVFNELDRRQRELFGNIRSAILEALDGLDLPEPLSSFFAQIRPVLEGMTDAILGDPDGELRRISIDLRSELDLSSLFAPLDTAFDRVVVMIESIPADTLTDTMNTIRQGVGVGLDTLDPRIVIDRLRSGQGRLAELNPSNILGPSMSLPGLKVAFQAQASLAPPGRQQDVAGVSARFEAVFGLVDPEQAESRLRDLGDRHDQLVGSLRRRINRLDTVGSSRAYADLNSSLDRLLPDFLRSPLPLTHAEVIAGINTLRPSARAEKIDRVLERFLQRVQPLEEALEPAIDGFFGSLRNVMALISPLLLKEAVADIYDVIREKVRILDPAELSDSIRINLYEPLMGPLQAINPGRIKLRINDAFDQALGAISTNVKEILDRIGLVLDQQLRAIRQEFRSLVEQVRETVDATLGRLQNIMNRVEQMVFKELLQRLSQVISNLGVSFDHELDRVRKAFDGMVAAIPV